MRDAPAVAADRLPTLTEVLELGRDGGAGLPAPGGWVASTALTALPTASPAPTTVLPGDLVAQVLALLDPRIGALLETQLREALAPALARAADGLIRDVRAELAPALRSLVEEAVAQALRQPR